MAEVRTEGTKWMPDQVRALEPSLASTKDKFAKGDHKAVLAEAPGLTGRARTSPRRRRRRRSSRRAGRR
jgi:hypothetical protein